MSALKDVKGLANLDLSVEITKPEYQVLIDRNKIADLGLTATQVANTIKTLVDGQIVTYYKEEGYYYPIRLVVNEENFRGKQDVANIPLFHKNGLIYLRDIAKIIYGVGPLEIDRQDQMRIIKEIRLRPEIGLHDLETKIRGAKEFLSEGNKVKFTIRLRGRQFLHTDRSESLVNQIIELLKDVAVVESEKPISEENREYTIVFSPKKQEEKKDGKRSKDAQRSSEEVQSNR
jgi:hypothetical protein